MPFRSCSHYKKEDKYMTQFDTPEYLAKVDAWWRAANYISVAQMYFLKDNPLLRRPIQKKTLNFIQSDTEEQSQDKTYLRTLKPSY